MTTNKQITANKQNASLSTGATTAEGKAIVSKNAVKHGIFTKELIISNGDGKENENEYQELLNGLVDSFSPNGQMEHLLVEKIAVDFWRLKRLLRFETGTLRKYLDMVIDEYYNETNWAGVLLHKTNEELDEKIAEKESSINWNLAYKQALEKNEVSFDAPTWENDSITSDITDDLYIVVKPLRYNVLTNKERELYDEGELNFEQLKEIISRAEYTYKDIAVELIKQLEKYNRDYEEEIQFFKKQKLQNQLTEEIAVSLNSLPKTEEAEKIMRYERSLQKSIMQNIVMLKQLQLAK
jgi:hypothetical protein